MIVKVNMTGRPDNPIHKAHVYAEQARREALVDRFMDLADDFRLAIVADMWLTASTCPARGTMYLHKQLAGYNLIQAIARVARWGKSSSRFF